MRSFACSPSPLPPSNVTWWEVAVTVVLATLVCVVAALLFNINYYRDFWAFWFCFVVATAHFSLVKVRQTVRSCWVYRAHLMQSE